MSVYTDFTIHIEHIKTEAMKFEGLVPKVFNQQINKNIIRLKE